MGTVHELDQLVYQDAVTVSSSSKPHSDCTPTSWATVNKPLSQTNHSSSCHSCYSPVSRHLPYISMLPFCRWENWHLESLCLAQGLITKKSEFEPRSVWFQTWPYFTATLRPGFGAWRAQQFHGQFSVSWSLVFLLCSPSPSSSSPVSPSILKLPWETTDNWHFGIYMSLLLLSFSSLCGNNKDKKRENASKINL